MKNIIIKMLYSLINRLVDIQVINAIREYIVRYSTEELEGYLKKIKVSDAVQIKVKDFLIDTEGFILSMIIDVVYAYLRNNKEVK